jgi:hypothetical protein
MSFRLGLLLVTVMSSLGVAQEKEKPSVLAFRFTYAEDANKDDDTVKLPYFRAFPDGKDKAGQDASGSLSTLKLARGESKLYKAEDAKPGLIVVLRRLLLVPLDSGDYTAILEGEFNAVRTKLGKKTMQKLLAGELTELVFESDTTRGIRPVAFRIQATTTFHARLAGGNLIVYGGSGGTTITRYTFTGTYVYESDPVPFAAENNSKPVYVGRAVKPVVKSDGTPETLPIVN